LTNSGLITDLTTNRTRTRCCCNLILQIDCCIFNTKPTDSTCLREVVVAVVATAFCTTVATIKVKPLLAVKRERISRINSICYKATIIISLNLNFILVNFLGNVVLDNEENVKLCLCPGCPTYKKSNFKSNVFCARGKAKEKVAISGCVCAGCSVFKNYSLDQMYYCVQGKSIDIKS